MRCKICKSDLIKRVVGVSLDVNNMNCISKEQVKKMYDDEYQVKFNVMKVSNNRLLCCPDCTYARRA